MDGSDTTIRSRELGEGLRRAMALAGLNGKATAAALGWSQTRLSRVLTGKRGVKEGDVAAFLGVCQVIDPERARLLGLCRERGEQGWWHQHGKHLPKPLLTLIEHESKATRIASFEAMTVPGLLQTGDYTTALLRESQHVPTSQIPARVAASLARQNLFSGDHPPVFTFYVHEFALRLPVGGPAVMAGQLHHLLRMATRPQVSIRVVPQAAGALAGTARPFTLLEVPEFRPVVHLDGLFVEKSGEIGVYDSILGRLDEVALSVPESQESIAALAAELYES